MNCDKCNKTTKPNEVLCCRSCRRFFHFICASISSTAYRKMSKEDKGAWKCSTCASDQENEDESATDNSLLLVREDLISEKIITVIRAEVSHLKANIDLIPELKKSTDFISAEYEEIKQLLKTNQDTLTSLQKENESLRSTVSDLTTRVHRLEQRERQSNVELHCIPESQRENLVAAVQQLATTVGRPLQSHEILSVTRVAKMNKESERPRSVIVKLPSPRCRDELLAAVSAFNNKNKTNKLSSSHLGIQGERKPIFVSEHLAPDAKLLHAATRRAAKQRKYKYVWIRNGRVLIRKDDNTPVIEVRNETFLDTLK